MSNLNNKLIKNFIFLILLLILMIWFFQVFLLNTSYETFRKNDIKKAFSSIKNLEDPNYLENISNKFESNILIYDLNGNIIYGNNNSIPKGLEREINANFITSSYKPINKDITLPRLDNKYNLYGNKVNNNYLLLISRLDPINSTTSIIVKQLVYVSIISIIISIIIAITLSKKISKPIKNINDKAKELGSNFDIEFNESDYIEVSELSKTLNDTTLKLKEKYNLQKDIISNISHDLKTPLTIIKGYAEVIRDTKSKKKNIYLEDIINEVDNLNNMINNIIETSKIEANSYIDKEEIDICLIMDKVLIRLEKIINDKNVIIKYNKSKLISNVDSKKIEQVFYNLLVNAIDHVGNDNTIEININNIVEIIDHGKGIDDTTHIFDKYYTTHNSKTSSGLGLYIVKTILEQHNIKYGVESIKNKYTKFYINF